MLLSLQFLRLIFTCPLREKKRSPRQTGIFISPADKKKTRNNSEENASSGDIVLEVLNMAESVTALLDRILYNSPSYSRILIGSRLWSIRGQTHDWRHDYKVFPSAVLKWRKVLRIRIIFYVTGQKIRYKKVLPRHWTGSRSQKTKDKAVSFRKWYRNNFLTASVRRQSSETKLRTNLVTIALSRI